MLLRGAILVGLMASLASPCAMITIELLYHKSPRSDTPLFRFTQNGKAGFINAEGRV
jgi:hypothetical protein